MKIFIYFLYFLIIKGEVINQTLKKPQPGVNVYLYRIEESRVVVVDSTISDRKGRFKLKLDEGVYVLKGVYKNALFRGIPFFIKKDTSVSLYIWELTENADSVIIPRIHMAIMPEKDFISVVEAMSFKNSSNSAYYKPFEIELPEEMMHFTPFSGVFPEEVHIVQNKLLYYLPLIPGESFLSYQYIIKGGFDFKRKFPFKINVFEIFTSPDLEIEGLGKGELRRIGDKEYRSFSLKNIEKNDEITFKVKLPRQMFNIKEIVPILVVLLFILSFLIYRWKKK